MEREEEVGEAINLSYFDFKMQPFAAYCSQLFVSCLLRFGLRTESCSRAEEYILGTGITRLIRNTMALFLTRPENIIIG